MEDAYTYLGIGWKFPPSFDRHSGSVEMVSGLEDVKESLTILMRTRVGERTMEPTYGSELTPLAFQQVDLNLQTFMVNNIRQTIAEHEPRVDVLEVTLCTPDTGEGSIDIHLTYKIKGEDLTEVLQYRYHPIFNQ